MSSKRSIDLIQELLREARRNKNFDSKYQDLAYQIGYLMGLVASLADRDSLIKHELERKLDHIIRSNRK